MKARSKRADLVRIFAVNIALVAAAMLLACPAIARADTYWQGTSTGDDWNVASNWTAGIPISSTYAYIVNGQTAHVYSTDPAITVSWIRAGFAGTNSGGVLQDGSSVTAATVWLGNNAYAGTYVLNAGTFAVTTDAYFGEGNGSNMFTQNGGTANIAKLHDGSNTNPTTGAFTYNMYNGVLNVSTAFEVANTGGANISGTFNQFGGFVVGTPTLSLGSKAGTTGCAIYNLSGGTLELDNATPFSFTQPGAPVYFNFSNLGGVLDLKGTWNYSSLTAIANSKFEVSGSLATSSQLQFQSILINGSTYTQISAMSATWTGTGGNTDWANASNWTSTGVPAKGMLATFGSEAPAYAVADLLTTGGTVGGITFNAATSTTIQSTGTSGPYTLTLDNNGSAATISVAGSHSITAPLALNNALTVTGTGALSIAGAITGTGASLTTGGAVTLTLGGTNTYGGATNINGGTLRVSADANLGSGGAVTFNGGTLQTVTTGITSPRAVTLNAAGGTFDSNGLSSTLSGAIGGSGALTKAGNGTLTLTGSNTYSGGTTVSGGSLTIGSGGTLGSITGNVALAAPGAMLTFNRSDNTTFTGAVTGTGGLAKAGAGTLTVSGTSTYSGPTMITGGTLKFNQGVSYPTSGLKGLWNFNDSTANDSSGNGRNGTAVNSPTYSTDTHTGSGYSLQLNGSNQLVYVDTGGAGNQTVFDGGSAMTISAWVKGWPSATWGPFTSKYGEGTTGWQMRKNGTSTTNLSWTTRPQGDTNDTSSVNNGAWHMITMTYDASGGANNKKTYVDGSLIGQSTATGNIGASAAMMAFGARATNEAYSTTDWTNYFGGKLDDIYFYNRALASTEVQQLYTSNGGPGSYANLLPVATPLTIAAGAAFDLAGGTQQVASLSDYSPDLAGSVQSSFTGTTAFLMVSPAAGSATFSGSILGGGGNGPLSLVKTGAGTQVLCGSNSYTGTTAVNGGILQFSGTASLPAWNTTGKVSVGNGGTLAVNTGGLNEWTLDNIGTLVTSATFSAGSALGIDTSNAAPGGVTWTPTIAGPAGLTKFGGNTLTVTGTSTYTGATTVSGGTLTLAGALSGSSSVAVLGGAALSGTGTLGPVMVASGGHLMPGSGGAGALNCQNLYLAAGSILDYSGALASAAGTLTVPTNAGGVTVNLASAFVPGSYVLLNYGTLATSGTNVLDPQTAFVLGSGGTGGYKYTFTNPAGAIDLNVSILPSSATWTGSGTDANWSTGANWTTALSGSESLTFAGTGATTYNDIGANQFGGITFAAGAGAFTLAGSTVNLAGDVVNSSSALQTINLNLALQQATGFTTTSGGGDLLVGGTISGGTAAVVTKRGAGTLVLTASNTYSGPTVIYGGTLQIGNGGSSGSIDASSGVSDYATLQFNRSDNVTFLLNVSGNGSLVQAGSGTLLLAGSNTYTGGTIVSAGVLQLGNVSALGTGGLTLGGGTLDLAGYSPTVGALSGTNATGLITTSSAALSVLTTSPASGTSTYAGMMTNGAGTLGLIKSGAGMLVLTGTNNTYGGGTTISAGALMLAAANALPTGGNITASGGTLDLGALNQGTSGTVSFQGGSVQNGTLTETGTAALDGRSGIVSARLAGGVGLSKSTSGLLVLSGSNLYTGGTTINGGTLQLGAANSLPGSGGVSLSNSAGAVLNLNNFNQAIGVLSGGGTAGGNLMLGTATLTLAGSVNSVYSGQISGSGGLVQQGPAMLTLGGSNVYSGGTSVTGGTLQLGNAGALGTGGLTLGAATLDLAGYSPTVGALSGASAAGLITTSSAALSVLTTSPASGTTTYAGMMTNGAGTLGLIKSGAGMLVLTGTSNTYSGGTTISAGTLTLAAVNALPTGGNITASGGTLDLGALSQGTSGTVSFQGGTVQNGLLTETGTAAFDGRSGVVSARLAGGVGLNKSTSGTLTLSGSNSFSGGVALTAGQLNINNASALGSGTLGIAGGNFDNTSGGAITLSTNNVQTWSNDFTFVGSSNLNLGSGTATLGGNRQVTVSGGTLTVAGPVVDGGGNFSLTKAGSGTLVLSGSNTYGGATNLNGGIVNFAQYSLGNGTAVSFNGGGLQYAAGNTLDLSARTVTLAASGGTIDTGPNAGIIFANPIGNGGAGSLTKAGTGMLTLVGTQTYTGATSITAGTLQLGSGGAAAALASASVTVGSSALLTFNHSDAQTFAANISGMGGLYQTGGGTLTLTGTNSFIAPAGVNGGALVGNTASLPAPINLASAANVVFNQTADGAFSNAISGSGSFVKTGTGTLTLSATSSYSGATVISQGTVRLGSTLLADSLLSTTLDATKWTVNKSANGNSNVIATASGVDLVSRGYLNSLKQYDAAQTRGLIITGNWKFTNTSSGNPDMLQIVIASSGTPGGTYGETTNGIEFHYQQGNATPTYQNDGTYTITTTASSGNLSVSQNDNMWFSCSNDGSGHLSFLLKDLTNSTSGSVTGTVATGTATANYITFHNRESSGFTSLLSNVVVNSYGGGGSANLLPTLTPMTIATGATFDLSGDSQQVASLADYNTLGNGGSVVNSNTNVASLLTLSGTGGATTFSGQILGGGTLGTVSLTMSGSGTQVLAGANTYTGVTTLGGGVLSVNSLALGGSASGIGASPSAAGNLVFNGGALQYTGPATSTDRLFTVGAIGGTLDASGSGAVVFSNTGNLAYSGTGPRTFTLTGSNTGANTLAARLNNSGTDVTSLVKNGPGTWVLTRNNTFTGTTTVNTGELDLNCATDVALSGNLVVAGGLVRALANDQLLQAVTVAGGTLDMGSGTNVVAGVTLSNGAINGTTGGLTSTTAYNMQAGSASVALSGTVGLTKSTTGTVTLSGSNSYTGGTTVNNGTLNIATADSLPTSGNLTITSSGHIVLSSGLSHAISLGGLTITSGAGVGQAAFGAGLPTAPTSGAWSGDPAPTAAQAGSVTNGAGGAGPELGGAAAPAAPTPEPGTLALLAAATMAGLAVWRKRRFVI